MILAGIDEAGLGPVLGPLVTSAAVFRYAPPAEGGEAVETPDLWSLLRSCVSRDLRRARKGGVLAVADSKKIYSRRKPDGLAPLERGVLTMLCCLAGRPSGASAPATFGEFLEAVSPDSRRAAREYPWFARDDLPLPRLAAVTDVELTANAVRLGLRKAGVEFLSLRAEAVQAGEFNRLVAASRNKSTTAFDVAGRLLMHVWSATAECDLRVVVDHQGGRVHYREPLQRLFEGGELKILEETDSRSAYRVRRDGRNLTVSFEVGGEEKSFAVALASMVSKYIRELFMEQFNDFWTRRISHLLPTAGYYVDGRRFYERIEPEMRRLGIDPRLVYRER